MQLDVRELPLELVGVDHQRFVPQKLRALQKGVRVPRLEVALQLLAVAGAEAVPELRAAVVEVVDAGELQVLGVPGEHGLEAADVEVGAGHARKVRLAQSVAAEPTEARSPGS